MKKIKVPPRQKVKRTLLASIRAKLGLSAEDASDYQHTLVVLLNALLFETGEVNIPGFCRIKTHVVRRRDNRYLDDLPTTKRLHLKVLWDSTMRERLQEYRKKEIEKQIQKYQDEYEQYCADHPGFRFIPDPWIRKDVYLKHRDKKRAMRKKYLEQKRKFRQMLEAESVKAIKKARTSQDFSIPLPENKAHGSSI